MVMANKAFVKLIALCSSFKKREYASLYPLIPINMLQDGRDLFNTLY